MEWRINKPERVVGGSSFRIKLSRALGSVTDEHTLVISLLSTLYILPRVNIRIFDSYFINTITSFMVVFIICDNALHLLINMLIKTSKSDTPP